jgi:hypothetical protein
MKLKFAWESNNNRPRYLNIRVKRGAGQSARCQYVRIHIKAHTARHSILSRMRKSDSHATV